MKANELMQGDLVLYEYNGEKFHARVVETYRSSALVESVGKEYEPIEIEEDKLFPIPLSPEILEKNGFEARGYKELVLDADECCFALQEGVDGINSWWWEMFSSPIIPINYVHQLQLALCLCGITLNIKV